MPGRSNDRRPVTGRASTRHGIDTSFENMIYSATGREIFDTSVSTINTTQLESATVNRGGAADPEGTILEDSYSGVFDESQVHNDSYLQESQRVLDCESDLNTTCPTDSFDSGNLEKQAPAKKSRPKPASTKFKNKTYITFDSSGASTTSTLRHGCRQNCSYVLLGFAVLLVGLSIGGTAMIVMNVFGKSPDKVPSDATAAGTAQHDSSTDDIVGPVTVTMWTKSPTSLPTQIPSQFPTDAPSSAPTTVAPSPAPSIRRTNAPSIAPTDFPSNVPTGIPTSGPSTAPSLMGPTSTPSLLPTRLASAPPSSTPTIAPTRAPVDMGNSRFFPFLEDVVADVATLTDVNSPQGRALEWLEREDELELDILELDENTPEEDKERMLRNLHQRFALVALDFALHDTVHETTWSFPRLHVCVWTGAKCNAAREVNGINWARMNLTGTIPPELGLLTNVVSLDLAQNQLKGSLDPLYSLTDAKDIFVFENQLSGPFTRGIENCRNLTRFMAGYNQLTGQLPALDMRSLLWFNVHHNQFSGTIPSALALDKVKIFDISSNAISGQIPINFVENIVPNIRHLYLGNNMLNGTVPDDFVNLGKGRVLQIYMNDNQLSGGFPTRFEEVKHLTNLDLSNNLFTQRLGKMCRMSVFEYGELVEMRADCRICNCDRICRTCHDNIDHLYEYDDDEWLFDDDSLFDDDDEADDDDDDDDDDDAGFDITAVGQVEILAQDDDADDDDDDDDFDDDDDDFTPAPPAPRPAPQPENEDDDDDDNVPAALPAPQIINQNNDDGNDIHGTRPVPTEFNVVTRNEDDDDDDDDNFFIIPGPGQTAQLNIINGGDDEDEGEDFNFWEDGDDANLFGGQDRQ